MKYMRRRLKWAGRMESMGEEKTGKKSRCSESGGKMDRGRSRLRWSDCAKGYMERVGEEWRIKAKDSRN